MKKTVILLILAIGLGSFIYFYEVKGGEAREEAKEREASLLKIDSDDVQSVALIKEGGDTLMYERGEGENWRIISPVITEAERSAVNSNVGAFVRADIKRRIATSREKLKNFGLDPPQVDVIIKTRDERQMHLLVGDKSATRGDMFVAYKDSLEVLVTSSNILTQAGKSLFNLRDKKIAHFESDDVRKIEIASENGEVVLEKSGGDWEMLKPAGVPVDASRVNSFLSSVRGYSAKEFVQEEFDDGSPFGFTEPVAKVRLSLGEERATKEIVIGKKLEDEETFYGYESGRPPVFIVRESTKKSLSKQPFYFQDKKIVKFEKDKVTEIRFSGAYQITVSKEDTLGWYAHGDSTVKVENSQISRLFSNLSSLNARELVTYEPEDLGNYGLKVPFLDVTLFTGEENAGGFDVGDEIDKDRYVRSKIYPFVFKIALSQINRVTDWLDDLFPSD